MRKDDTTASSTVDTMELVEPRADYKESFIEAVKEYQAVPETDSTRRYRALSIFELERSFEDFIERERSHADGRNQPEGYVPQTEYWLVDKGEYIGHVGIRQKLTDHLHEIGGHIGYDIRPSKRCQGYGTKILELALEKAKEIGIEKVRITCDVSNIPSRKIIEKNGGVLESEIPNPETGINKARFWIENK